MRTISVASRFVVNESLEVVQIHASLTTFSGRSPVEYNKGGNVWCRCVSQNNRTTVDERARHNPLHSQSNVLDLKSYIYEQ